LIESNNGYDDRVAISPAAASRSAAQKTSSITWLTLSASRELSVRLGSLAA
jgi:hypothetical protein